MDVRACNLYISNEFLGMQLIKFSSDVARGDVQNFPLTLQPYSNQRRWLSRKFIWTFRKSFLQKCWLCHCSDLTHMNSYKHAATIFPKKKVWTQTIEINFLNKFNSTTQFPTQIIWWGTQNCTENFVNHLNCIKKV